MNHIVLLSGWWSSVFNRYRVWADMLEASLPPYKDTKVWNLSADGMGEKPALQAIMRDNNRKKVILIGHSNGARDVLFMAETLYHADIPVHYLASLDMTLGEFGAEAFGNIKFLDEFHARLEKVDFDKSFKKTGANYSYWQVYKPGTNRPAGHVEMARQDEVQQRLRFKIAETMNS